MQEAILGAGCFWCVEAIFQRLKGVKSVEAGYSGGHVENPSYNAVCSGDTGHAEVARIEFDENQLSFEDLLEVFFLTHDPTTLNRQGNDIGSQYRSVIFYQNEDQRKTAESMKDKMNKSDEFDSPIVTEISPLVNYYKAEDYHQNFFNNNPAQPYCAAVVGPKVRKFMDKFDTKLKTS